MRALDNHRRFCLPAVAGAALIGLFVAGAAARPAPPDEEGGPDGRSFQRQGEPGDERGPGPGFDRSRAYADRESGPGDRGGPGRNEDGGPPLRPMSRSNRGEMRDEGGQGLRPRRAASVAGCGAATEKKAPAPACGAGLKVPCAVAVASKSLA